jgi:hypothetical protein
MPDIDPGALTSNVPLAEGHPGVAAREVIGELSADELRTLAALKQRIEDAVGEDTVHSPQDGGLFW